MKKDFLRRELHVYYDVAFVTHCWDGAHVWEYTLRIADTNPTLSNYLDTNLYAQITETKPYVRGISHYDLHGIAVGDRVSVVFADSYAGDGSHWDPRPIRFYKP